MSHKKNKPCPFDNFFYTMALVRVMIVVKMLLMIIIYYSTLLLSLWFCWMVFIFLFLGVNIYRWSQLIRVDLIWCSAVMLLSVSVNGRRVLYLKALRLSNQWSTWSKGFKNYNRMYLTPLYERNIYSPSASCSKVVDGHVWFGLHGCFELNPRLNGFE
jgi:hypothetical protein